jgi:hypothetical protein
VAGFPSHLEANTKFKTGINLGGYNREEGKVKVLDVEGGGECSITRRTREWSGRHLENKFTWILIFFMILYLQIRLLPKICNPQLNIHSTSAVA